MSAVTSVSPRNFLNGLGGKEVVVKLKWGMEYAGILSSFDGYMNLQLQNATEYVDSRCTGAVGEVLIRCNNVLYISEVNKSLDKEEKIPSSATSASKRKRSRSSSPAADLEAEKSDIEIEAQPEN